MGTRSGHKPRRRGLKGLLCTGVSLTTVLLTSGAATASTGSATTYPVGTTLASGVAADLLNPNSSPPGVNLSNCRPSPAHPYPVVLVPGTFATDALSWQALGPILANNGYCVYGLNYGQNALTTLTAGRVAAVGDIPTSAAQLGTFVSQALRQTGASQVDIVGWSQGGMMPRWYMDEDGGATYVHDFVGLAPSNHGTTLDGLSSLVSGLGALGLPVLTLTGCTACTQQMAGSTFLKELNAGGDVTAGVQETVIETKYDEVVTPYQSAFLDGADNITLQDQCPSDFTDHLGIPYDSVAIQDVLNALGADQAGFQPDCTLSLPVLGTP